MTNRFLGRKWHVKPRIFIMLLLLMVIVFTGVFVAFNLFINSYIRANVEEQLNGLVKNSSVPDDRPREHPPEAFYIPDLSGQQRNRIGARGEVIVLDADYEIKAYDERGDKSPDDLQQIASALQKQAVNLSDARYVRINTDEDTYYISAVEDKRASGNFFVFYVNVSGLMHLVGTINLSLAIIMALAMLICFLMANVIAGSITKPVKALSNFAEEMGKGNFKRREFVFQDIEFDELGEAMNQSAEKLEAYDKDQHAFFQNVSHELRTPLQSIRCHAEGVEYGLMDPVQSGATIISETDRLSELVEDLLYISRVDSITSHVELQENDLRDTLSLCAELLRPMADKKGLRFIYEFDERPVLLSYNEKHMYRAFSNLISNALRYAKGSITLSCHSHDGYVAVSIADDGPGISGDDLPHIFERFYKGADGKHGIGLSIVKSVVELHGGEIMVDRDEGTRFTILLPKN
jgi:two-component system sensor histidine kinase CssS